MARSVRIRTSTYISLRMQFNDELFALKAEFPDLCPRERVDLRNILKDDDPGVGDGQRQNYSIVVLLCNEEICKLDLF